MPELSIKEKREQKRANELLDAAQAIFTEKGYYGATVNDIAELSLISKFTVYQYFNGKDAILNAILARGYSILTDCVKKSIEVEKDPGRRLYNLIHAELEFFEKRKAFFEMLFVEKLDFESEVKNDILPSYREHLRCIEKEIQASIGRGCLRHVDTEDAAYMVFAVLRSFALRWLFQGAEGKLTDKTDTVHDLIMKGLVADRA